MEDMIQKREGRGTTFKNWVGQNFLLERGDKPEMGGVGVLPFFTTLQFSSVTFTLCGGK